MTSLLNQYSEFNDIFKNIKGNEKSISKKDKIEEMPEPTDYRISTMTMITSFNTNINLYVVDKYFELDDKIISMEYGDKPVKNKKGQKKRITDHFSIKLLLKLNSIH